MQILTEDEAAVLLNASDLRSFVADVAWQYPDTVPNYRLPKDSGVKVALARLIANFLLDRGPFLLWVTGTGIWSSGEHLDLFDRYRMSFGESRSIQDAPLHRLGLGDRDAAISLLCMGLFFVWDVELVSTNRSIAITFSHDEWMEVRHAPGELKLAEQLENLLVGFHH